MSSPANANGFEPAYLALLRRGELAACVASAFRHLEDCDLCARYCHVNRHLTAEEYRAALQTREVREISATPRSDPVNI